jgi:hypothetical protein
VRYFELAQKVMDERYSMRGRGMAGAMLFADRKMTFVPHTARQDNYHPPRQLMLALLTLDRMMKK